MVLVNLCILMWLYLCCLRCFVVILRICLCCFFCLGVIVCLNFVKLKLMYYYIFGFLKMDMCYCLFVMMVVDIGEMKFRVL